MTALSLVLQLLLPELLPLFHLDHEEAIELEDDDQGVLGREEYVHVGHQVVVEDQEEPKDEEGGVLQDDVNEHAPHVQGTTDLLHRSSPGNILEIFPYFEGF